MCLCAQQQLHFGAGVHFAANANGSRGERCFVQCITQSLFAHVRGFCVPSALVS